MPTCSQIEPLAPQPEDSDPLSLSLGQWELWKPLRGLSPLVLEDVGVAADLQAVCPAGLVWARSSEKELWVDGIPP